MEAVSDGNLATGADDYKKVIRCLRRQLVGPDLSAWQVRRAGSACAQLPCPPSPHACATSSVFMAVLRMCCCHTSCPWSLVRHFGS